MQGTPKGRGDARGDGVTVQLIRVERSNVSAMVLVAESRGWRSARKARRQWKSEDALRRELVVHEDRGGFRRHQASVSMTT